MNIERRLVRKSQLEKLFGIIKGSGRKVYAPFTRNGKTSFRNIEDFSEIAVGYIQTTQSSKEVSFPRTEKILDFSKDEQGISVKGRDLGGFKESILWGVRPCDAMGIGQLSSIFNWDYSDEIYNSRLSKVTVISFSCIKADEYCFCTSVGGNPGNTTGNDILFTQMGENGDYLAEIITEKGAMVVSLAPDLFEPAENVEKEKYLAGVPVRFSREEITGKLEKIFESPEWVKLSLKCIGCGACAYVCPTCACFDIQDEAHGKSGLRVRCWDSCGFSLFTRHTSGHNPREVQSQRWRQRIMHKFSYMPERLSVYGCTGCGRCSRACPADMNILEHLITIKEAEV
ncbi:MAG: 4Fe-4S dicluster domain-containing protein [Bacteroidales bacterium]|jgi:formate hydrogenlyase subunit 6/NADH:ubiquinone oxidoreductase subunit I